ncbi:MAG: right-handed parallel beta-helix repeat-containing protein, partial [Dehalococcoidia bacterium]|nr:right-handed parallel beta-helix repeat-containing protein [Dehalococcoidia bacterium]
VGLTLALLTSLLLTAAPVSALSSATVTIPDAHDEISFLNAEYSIFFTIHEELDQNDFITVTFPDDTVLSAGVPTATIAASSGWVGTSYQTAIITPSWAHVVADRTLTVTLTGGTDRIGASAEVMINVTVGITNPTTPGEDYTLTVETADSVGAIEAAVESAPYTIEPPLIVAPPTTVRVFNPAGIEFQPQTGPDAIISAIGLVTSAGWTLTIGAGTYEHTAPPLDINEVDLTINASAGADILIVGDVDITASGLTLDGVTIEGTLDITATGDEAVIQNVAFEGAQDMITVATGADTPDIDNCTFAVEAGFTGITLLDEADITNNTFTLEANALAINVGGAVTGTNITDNTFTGGSGDGIVLGFDATVSGNTFDGLAGVIGITTANVTFSGNTITGSEESAIVVVSLAGGEEVYIVSNTFTGNNDAAILEVTGDAEFVFMLFNTITDNAGDADGLLIDNNDAAELFVVNNWWGDVAGPGAAAFSTDL